jgi:hypothetical protein
MRIYPTSLRSSCSSGEYNIALLICTAITQSSRDLHRVEGIESTVNLMNLYLTWFISERPTQVSAPLNTSAAPAQQRSATLQQITSLYIIR